MENMISTEDVLKVLKVMVCGNGEFYLHRSKMHQVATLYTDTIVNGMGKRRSTITIDLPRSGSGSITYGTCGEWNPEKNRYEKDYGQSHRTITDRRYKKILDFIEELAKLSQQYHQETYNTHQRYDGTFENVA